MIATFEPPLDVWNESEAAKLMVISIAAQRFSISILHHFDAIEIFSHRFEEQRKSEDGATAAPT